MNMNFETYGDSNNPPLVLVFGFSMSIEDWVDFGYVDLLENDFYVISIEPFGHGRSDIFHSAQDYSLDSMSQMIKGIMDDLHVSRAVIWGYSIGAKILLHFAGTHPEMTEGLVLGGFEVHSKVDLTDDLVFETLGLGAQEWLGLWRTMFMVPEPLAKRLLTIDIHGLQALRCAEAAWPDLSSIPEKLQVNCICYAGEQCFFREQTEEVSKLFKKSRFIEVPSRNHFELMTDPESICHDVVGKFSATV